MRRSTVPKNDYLIVSFLAATEIELTEEEQKYLEEPYIPVSILGHS